MKQTEIKDNWHTVAQCKGVHCRCMQTDCTNYHYVDHLETIPESKECKCIKPHIFGHLNHCHQRPEECGQILSEQEGYGKYKIPPQPNKITARCSNMKPCPVHQRPESANCPNCKIEGITLTACDFHMKNGFNFDFRSHQRRETDWRREFRDERANINLYTTADIEAFIERSREEIYQNGYERGRAEGASEERQFILNILDGIDTANEQMGLPYDTKAIRFALKSRILPSPPHKSV